MTSRGRDRLLRLNPGSASSCAFNPGYNSHYDDFVWSMRRPTAGELLGPNPVGFDEDGLGNGYFRLNASLGDASSDGRSPSVFRSDQTVGGCRDIDFFSAQARARIAAKDRTLPTGYDLYEAGRLPEAAVMFKKAYRKLPDGYGGAEASLMIGRIQLELGDSSTFPEALMWLRRAANSVVSYTHPPRVDAANPQDYGSPAAEASMILSRVYSLGYGAPKDLEASRRWLSRAAYVGYPAAAKVLGDIYYRGVDAPRNLRVAAVHYTRAAKLGHPPAQYALAEIKSGGGDGAAPDLKTALTWYAQAARRGHPEALYALAVAHDRGNGVAADPHKALGFYKEAALAGNAAAQGALGTYFYEGRLVPNDPAIARKWFETAAVAGDRDAMFNLAVMLSKAEGGEADLVKAWVWFKLADTLRRENAGVAMSAVERRMTPAQREAAEAIVAPRKAG